MLAPLRWIRDYADITLTAEELAEKMIMTGNGVEDIINLGDDVINVVTGKIVKIEKHPDADRLLVCQVDVGSETLQIVTAATNVFEGAAVPVALVGAKTANGLAIKKGKLRGVPSLGMFCSGEEIGVTESDFEGAGVDGIFILKGEVPLGVDIREFLGISGSVIDFEIGANRPDCLSVMGIAREAAAAADAAFKAPDTSFAACAKNVQDLVSVEVMDAELCPRYLAGGVVNVKIGESPDWMKKRLKEAGIRPINNIVDITNFVMIETGQPMHAFDYDDIRGKGIVVRRAQKGEKLTTLDGKERDLSESMLLICDKEGAIGLAGIMGGENSEIKDTTKTVIFESAKFMYGNIRQTSRALGVSTEASMRFSKGVDAVTSEFALRRALHLVQQLEAGEVCGGITDVCAEDLSPKTVTTTAQKVNALLGTDISAEDMGDYLNKAFIATRVSGGTLTCSIPSFRGDIEGGADIAEEVARMYGYDNIGEQTMTGDIARGGVSEDEAAKDGIKDYLTKSGFLECATYSFAGEQDYARLGIEMPKSVKIKNPLGDDRGFMRTNMLYNILSVVAFNLAKKNEELKLFETGKIFIPKALPVTELPDEYPVLSLAVVGEKADFFTLKGYIENIADMLCGSDIACVRGEQPYFHPGVNAEILINGEVIGEMGEISTRCAENFGIDKKVYAAQIRLDKLMSFKKKAIKFASLPKFPAAQRDIAVIAGDETGAGDMLETIKKAGGKKLENAEVFDVYKGAQLGEGKKSVAYSLVLRAADHTLTDEETDAVVTKIISALEKEHGAKLR